MDLLDLQRPLPGQWEANIDWCSEIKCLSTSPSVITQGIQSNNLIGQFRLFCLGPGCRKTRIQSQDEFYYYLQYGQVFTLGFQLLPPSTTTLNNNVYITLFYWLFLHCLISRSVKCLRQPRLLKSHTNMQGLQQLSCTRRHHCRHPGQRVLLSSCFALLTFMNATAQLKKILLG